jgi:hypothetical protein
MKKFSKERQEQIKKEYLEYSGGFEPHDSQDEREDFLADYEGHPEQEAMEAFFEGWILECEARDKKEPKFVSEEVYLLEGVLNLTEKIGKMEDYNELCMKLDQEFALHFKLLRKYPDEEHFKRCESIVLAQASLCLLKGNSMGYQQARFQPGGSMGRLRVAYDKFRTKSALKKVG